MKLPRNTKRLIIIAVYLILFSLLGLGIYKLFKPAPTCFDGKMNQGEEKTDCGGPCKPCQEKILTKDLIIEEKGFVLGGQDRYDVMAKIYNPNVQYGGQSFDFRFLLKDSSGQIIAQREGSDFILPAETKYLVETNLGTQLNPETIEVEIKNLNWKEFAGYGEKPKLNIYDRSYNQNPSGTGINEVYGLLKNESAFDFNLIRINIVLRGEDQQLLAVNRTEMRTVNAGDQRDFKLAWPIYFSGEVKNMEIEANADVYDSQNFIKMYFPEQKFQEFQ